MYRRKRAAAVCRAVASGRLRHQRRGTSAGGVWGRRRALPACPLHRGPGGRADRAHRRLSFAGSTGWRTSVLRDGPRQAPAREVPPHGTSTRGTPHGTFTRAPPPHSNGTPMAPQWDTHSRDAPMGHPLQREPHGHPLPTAQPPGGLMGQGGLWDTHFDGASWDTHFEHGSSMEHQLRAAESEAQPVRGAPTRPPAS